MARAWLVESPAQILTPEEWRRKRRQDAASGHQRENPSVLYLTDGGTVLGPAFLVDAWPMEKQRQLSSIARALIVGDESHRKGCASGCYRDWERDSCGTCSLLGYGAHDEETGNPAPNYAGWCRVYVQASEPIPRAWLAAFLDALNDEENTLYRDALRRDVATFGYRLTDGRPGYRLPVPTPDKMRQWLRDYHGEDRAAIVADIDAIAADPRDYPAGPYSRAAVRIAQGIVARRRGQRR